LLCTRFARFSFRALTWRRHGLLRVLCVPGFVQLVMDCALNQKVRVHALKVLLWAVTEAAVILRVITQVRGACAGTL
jgi:hypothetical protein